jgi:hypothetical protein
MQLLFLIIEIGKAFASILINSPYSAHLFNHITDYSYKENETTQHHSNSTEVQLDRGLRVHVPKF